MKKWLALLLCGVLLISCCGCGRNKAEETTPTENTTIETTQTVKVPVGLCLPNQTEERWLEEGAALRNALEAKDCQVLLQDANDSALTQAEQMQLLVEEKVQCIVVAAVDSAALGESLALAKTVGIPVVAYDRILINTQDFAGFVGFDQTKLGQNVAQMIITAKALETAKAEKRSYTVELFMDTYQNQGNVLYYQGLMQGLQSYFDSGVLKCKSGRLQFEDVCVAKANLAEAKTLADTMLAEHYKESWPDILLAGNDVLASGWANALKGRNCPAENWPLIAGQNVTAEGASRIATGRQLLSVYYDTASLVQAGADAVAAALNGEAVGSQAVDNGLAQVPAQLFDPQIVTVENLEKMLLDTGVFTKEELMEN